MYIDTTFPPEVSGRLAQFMRMVDAFERNEIEAAVDGLIAVLDARDGDPDREDDHLGAVMMHADGSDATFDHFAAAHPECVNEGNGDEHDTGSAEDEEQTGFALQYRGDGPGCIISDAAEYAYIEQGNGAPEGTLRTFGNEDDEVSSVANLAYHRARIQRTRCDATVSRYQYQGMPIVHYRLRAPETRTPWNAA